MHMYKLQQSVVWSPSNAVCVTKPGGSSEGVWGEHTDIHTHCVCSQGKSVLFTEIQQADLHQFVNFTQRFFFLVLMLSVTCINIKALSIYSCGVLHSVCIFEDWFCCVFFSFFLC